MLSHALPLLVVIILFLVNKLPLVQVMSTIKGVGNKPLQHANSVTSLPSPAKLPKYNSKHCSLDLFFVGIFHCNFSRYGVVTPHEEELGVHLDDLAR